jgi:DNA-directed RNA polymerase specialized sigma24 family protein
MTTPFAAHPALATARAIPPSCAVSSSDKANTPNPELFNTTRWSVVLAAGNTKSAESEGALAWLCEHYWFPLYAYARQRGHRPPEAEDLVQGFFVRVLEREIFSDLSAERGRFRAFLLACFHHFMASEWAKTQSQKRGGGAIPVPLDEATAEERYARDFTESGTPEQDFDRAWALTLLDRVFERLRGECEAEGKGGRFSVIQPFLQSEREGRNYENAAAELAVTPTALRVMVFRMRQRFRDMLIDEIRQTVASAGEVAAELRHLFMALGK